MVDVPISWKITITGAADAKRQLAALQAEFGHDEGLKRYNAGVKEAYANNQAVGRAISYTNRSFRVQHQSLYEASKAFRILGTAMRGAMSIMNTLSLLTIAQSTQTTGIKQSMADAKVDILEMEKELTNLEKHGKKNTVEYQIKVQELEAAKQKLKDFDTELKNVANNEFWGKITTVGFAITEGIQTALMTLNNPTVSKYIFAAASKIGTLFGGVFTGVSTLIIKAGAWIKSLFLPLETSAKISGGLAGTAWGTAFTIATAIAIAAGGTILADVINEAITGKSQLKKTTGKSGSELIKDTTGIDIWNDPNHISGITKTPAEIMSPSNTGQETDVIGKAIQDAFKGINDWFKNLWNIPNSYEEIGGAIQGPNQVTGPMGGLVNTFGSKPIPVKIADISRPIFKDLGTGTSGTVSAIGGIIPEQVKTTIDNTDVIIEETKILEDEAKEAKMRASDNARMHHEAEMTALAAKQAMFEQTEATNALKITMAQALLAMQNTGGGGTGGGHSGSGGYYDTNGPTGQGNYQGSNGKYYNTQDEADRNNNTGAYAAARGFNGMVNNPTMFLAGEAGPEHVSITPRGSSGGSPSITINNYISGSILSERELEKISMNSLKNGLKRVGF